MSYHESIMSKIVSLQDLKSHLDNLRSDNKKTVVFTNGCFDLVHRGHVDYLSRARDLGDMLVVGLNSDASVKRLKGPSRPISNERSRATVMAAFGFVDFVVLFDEDTPLNLIKAICPDILVKGGDYNRDNVVGADFVESHGGRLELIPLVPGESTTRLVNNIQHCTEEQ
ncbi:MAG: D-glycero-beta-D-manno-heptose 1-phosphate adenylyltransferase [Bacteroidales bacterium]|nr:D-glycero-beta-D-manno-heptose 1-phosphate adenylyltransferase [Bacteroidales bacterium]